MTAPSLCLIANQALENMGARLRVTVPNAETFALGVGLARLYDREDRLIAAGKMDMADAFFIQPGMTPGFWAFFGYGRDKEAIEGWWWYAQEHGENLRDRWWTSLLARLLTGREVEMPIASLHRGADLEKAARGEVRCWRNCQGIRIWELA